jgi:hypothetical protein
MMPALPRLALLLCLAGALAPAAARPAEDGAQLERRLASVATLIDNSSAARQIEASANPAALQARAQARELQQQAAAAWSAGRAPDATRLLDEAARQMFGAVRLAAPEQLIAAKMQRDFDSRMESVKALLAAYERISAEKGRGAPGAPAGKAMQAQVATAAQLAGAGQLEQARSVLDQVYLGARQSIEALRNGDTLVRSLQFASKEEEYRYELDRNDTHLMLCKLLLAEKRSANATLDASVQAGLDQAAQLRANADGLAARKDYPSAVRLLEEATRELVRAIRGAGVYIPG